MALAEETWTDCSVYEVYEAFLKAERRKYVGVVPQGTLDFIDRPNLRIRCRTQNVFVDLLEACSDRRRDSPRHEMVLR